MYIDKQTENNYILFLKKYEEKVREFNENGDALFKRFSNFLSQPALNMTHENAVLFEKMYNKQMFASLLEDGKILNQTYNDVKKSGITYKDISKQNKSEVKRLEQLCKDLNIERDFVVEDLTSVVKFKKEFDGLLLEKDLF